MALFPRGCVKSRSSILLAKERRKAPALSEGAGWRFQLPSHDHAAGGGSSCSACDARPHQPLAHGFVRFSLFAPLIKHSDSYKGTAKVIQKERCGRGAGAGTPPLRPPSCVLVKEQLPLISCQCCAWFPGGGGVQAGNGLSPRVLLPNCWLALLLCPGHAECLQGGALQEWSCLGAESACQAGGAENR